MKRPEWTKGFGGSPLRFRSEKWFWTFMTFFVVFLDLVFKKYWLEITGTYIAATSNYALVLTLAGAEQAAEARVASQQNEKEKDE